MNSILANEIQKYPELAQRWREIAEQPDRSRRRFGNITAQNPLVYLRDKLHEMRQVDKVVESYSDGRMHLYFYFKERNRDLQRKVYDLQMDLLKQFKTYKFAFHDIVGAQESIETLINSKSTSIIYPINPVDGSLDRPS